MKKVNIMMGRNPLKSGPMMLRNFVRGWARVTICRNPLKSGPMMLHPRRMRMHRRHPTSQSPKIGSYDATAMRL